MAVVTHINYARAPALLKMIKTIFHTWIHKKRWYISTVIGYNTVCYPLCCPLKLLLGSYSVYTQITTQAAGVFTFVGQIGPLSSAPKENWAASRSRVAVPKGPE